MKHRAGFFICLFWSLGIFAQQSGETLENGNIRSFVQNAGVLFQQNGQAAFEVPKGSGIQGILSSGLWIGGRDSSGGLRLSVATYDTSGRDFQAGPIDLITQQADDSTYWNYVWKVDSTQIENHKTLYNNVGYQAPWSISQWPGSNKRPGNYNQILAPFIDLNNNSIYEPDMGEVPYIKGNEAAYFLMNDLRAQHQLSGTKGMGLEIYGMVYTDPTLPNTVFLKYRIVNRSFSQYDSLFAGIYTDFMLGNPFDNYTSTDSARHTYFCYNGLSYDSFGYEDMPPVIGVKFLQGRLDKTIGFNEDVSGAQGWPETADDYYGYMKALWKDGSELMDPNSAQTSYIYQGDPCNGSGWTEYGSSGVIPGRRNMLGTTGPYSLKHGETISLDIAYIFTRKQKDLLPNVCDFYKDADATQAYWDDVLSSVGWTPEKRDLHIYPNPVNTKLYWDLPEGVVLSSILLFDMKGKLIPVQPSSNSLDLSGLADGMYLLRIIDRNGNSYQNKIIKTP